MSGRRFNSRWSELPGLRGEGRNWSVFAAVTG